MSKPTYSSGCASSIDRSARTVSFPLYPASVWPFWGPMISGRYPAARRRAYGSRNSESSNPGPSSTAIVRSARWSLGSGFFLSVLRFMSTPVFYLGRWWALADSVAGRADVRQSIGHVVWQDRARRADRQLRRPHHVGQRQDPRQPAVPVQDRQAPNLAVAPDLVGRRQAVAGGRALKPPRHSL